MTDKMSPEPDDWFCLTPQGRITWQQFAEDVARTRTAIKGHDAICNLAERRYAFCVVLSATMLNGQRTVLPPAQAERAIEQALAPYASPRIVRDIDEFADIETQDTAPAEMTAAFTLYSALGDLQIFTSGSTGKPIAHFKTWRTLDGGARLSAELIERAGLERFDCLLAGTTPHQHMYGLEAAVFTGLSHGYTLYDARVFYPADLDVLDQRAAEAGLSSIALITSPPHLKFLAEKIRQLPRIRCVISATAPLSRDLAGQVDDGQAAPVFEIYGSTETGSLAWRRTILDDLWTPLDGFHLLPGPDGWRAASPHLPEITPLSDDIEQMSDDRFLLLGRRGDMVRIAGKRHGLGALNAILVSLPMIADGAVLREIVQGEDRLHIFVVPADREQEHQELIGAVKAYLRQHIDPVFIPRAMRVVDTLPRDDTGKISASDGAVLIANGRPSSTGSCDAKPA